MPDLPPIRRLVPLLALALGPLSCASLQPAAYEDYIGPELRKRAAATAPATAAATAPATRRLSTADGPIKLTLEEAILVALENNRELAVQRLAPRIRQTFEDQERALFDPLATASIQQSRVKAQRLARAGAGTEHSAVDSILAAAGLSQFLPTGTTVGVDASSTYTDSSLSDDTFVATRVSLTATQALLNGFGTDVNLASLRQARLDTLASQYELRGFAEALLADVETTYWDYVLAERQIEIFTESLALARRQLDETQQRVEIGRLSEMELAAMRAEVALRQEALINARSTLATTALRLLRLLNPDGADPLTRKIVLLNRPSAPRDELDDVQTHVSAALNMRPDMNQARLALQRDELEIVKTRNGLLPRLDLFITLGKTGYSEVFGRSAQNVRGDTYDVLMGARFSYPLGNRDARAQHARATFTRLQTREALANLAQLVELDVRAAYIEIRRAAEQVTATAATRKLQEETLRAETEKFRVGKSTSLLVARAQRDLVASRIAEVEAVINYSKAMVSFYRLEGTLLIRRGIAAPGREPILEDIPRR